MQQAELSIEGSERIEDLYDMTTLWWKTLRKCITLTQHHCEWNRFGSYWFRDTVPLLLSSPFEDHSSHVVTEKTRLLRYMHTQTGRQTDRQTDRQTQTNKQTNDQTNTHTQTHTHTSDIHTHIRKIIVVDRMPRRLRKYISNHCSRKTLHRKNTWSWRLARLAFLFIAHWIWPKPNCTLDKASNL